jgi:hypothetical protein
MRFTVQQILPQETLLSIVTPLLDDPVISVRTEAMNAIAPFYSQLDETKKTTLRCCHE